MQFKIVEQNTREDIGEITLGYVPRTGEYLLFNETTYGIVNIIHAADHVILKVVDGSIKADEITTEWN